MVDTRDDEGVRVLTDLPEVDAMRAMETLQRFVEGLEASEG